MIKVFLMERQQFRHAAIFLLPILAAITKGAPAPVRAADAPSVQGSPTPAESPASPIGLTATGRSPFQVELRWRSGSANEYGFVVERKATSGSWIRVALVDPDVTSLVHHGLRPRTSYLYRVRAFNPRGVSEPSSEATAKTKEVTDPPELLGARVPTPAPCTSLGRAKASLVTVDGSKGEETAVVTKVRLGRHTATIINDGSCFSQNCPALLYGEDGGCFRELGDFNNVGSANDFRILTLAPSGWPLLVDSWHYSASRAPFRILQLVNGHYTVVDEFTQCSGVETGLPEGKGLVQATPPFPNCQQDDDLDL